MQVQLSDMSITEQVIAKFSTLILDSLRVRFYNLRKVKKFFHLENPNWLICVWTKIDLGLAFTVVKTKLTRNGSRNLECCFSDNL